MALTAMPTHLTLNVAPYHSVMFEKEPLENVEISDDDSMTDDSSDASPTTSLASVKTHAMDAGSPSSVEHVADASAPGWPARPLRRKRKRMSQEERKVRHREVQRQFMKRKRARIAELRKVQTVVEKELRFVSMLREIEQIKTENAVLEKKLEACKDVAPAPQSDESQDFGGLVFSVPAEDDETEKDWAITEFEWSDILDVLSDDGCADIVMDVSS